MKNHHWQNAVPGSDTAQLKSISWKSMVTPIEAGIVIYQWTDTLYIYIYRYHIQLAWNGISRVGSCLSLFELTCQENNFSKSVLVWHLQPNVVTSPANQNQRFTPERRMDQRPQQLNLLGLSLGQEPVARNMYGHVCNMEGFNQKWISIYKTYTQYIYLHIQVYLLYGYYKHHSICQLWFNFSISDYIECLRSCFPLFGYSTFLLEPWKSCSDPFLLTNKNNKGEVATSPHWLCCHLVV